MGSGALMRTKLSIIIEALNDGVTIEIDGQKYCFGEDENGNTVLCIELQRVDLATRAVTPILSRCGVSFDYFFNACEKMSEGDVMAIAAGNVLRKERTVR